MKASYSARGPELLIDLMAQSARIIAEEAALPAHMSEAIGVKIAEQMAKNWGGRLIYVPTGTWNGGSLTCFQLGARDIRIEREFIGSNRREICERYGISAQRLYQIIASVRLARARARDRERAGG